MALPNTLKYGFIWILPLISAAMWVAMLLAMLIVWLTQGRPKYASMEAQQDIAYISDVGASGLKPLFITGCVITTVFLDLSFASERWLRHTGRLAKNLGLAEKVLSGLSIIFAIAGTAGLILLSIFDTAHHSRMHNGFLLLFIAGFVFSAIFVCAEYQRLGVHHRQHRVLRLSFWLKLFFILLEVALAVVFGSLMATGNHNSAAVVEWAISFIFTLYVLIFFVDLVPASRSTQQHANQEVMHQLEAQNGSAVVDRDNGQAKPQGVGGNF